MRVRFLIAVGCLAGLAYSGANAAPDAASPPVATDTQPSPEAAQLKAQGDHMLATGDLTTARLYYSRAAELGDAAAATAMGTTYDPAYFDQWSVRGVVPDPTTAESWYRKAIDLGDNDAVDKLRQLTKPADIPEPPAQQDAGTAGSNAPAPAPATPETSATALTHADTPPVAVPPMPAAGPGSLTQSSVEFILTESHVNFHMLPRDEFKVDLPDINFAWMTSDQVFGAVIQANMAEWHPEDAAPAFITRINSGCAGTISMKISAVEELKGATTTRQAESECETRTGTVKIHYAFVQNHPALTVFIAMGGNSDAATRHRDAIMATVRKMILAAN